MKTNKKKSSWRRLSIAADVFTIIGAIATIAGIIVGVSYVVHIEQTVNNYTTNRLLKRDTVIVTLSDTVFIEKRIPNDSPASDATKQEQTFEGYKTEVDRNFEEFKTKNEQNFEELKTKNDQNFEKWK
jgi:hypothetical protein